MKQYRVKSIRELKRLVTGHQRARQGHLVAALQRAAEACVVVVKRRVPVAFGELRESVDANKTLHGAELVVDAPHAAAVELGSRPHTPPLEPLEAWVKLRAAQGQLEDRQIQRLPGATTAAHARRVAGELNAQVHGGALSVDAPRSIAFRIQRHISRFGTRPHWYLRRSLPDILRTVRAFLRAAVKRD